PEQRLAVQVESPLEWVLPNVLTDITQPLPLGHFTFRAKAFASNARVEVRQGGRVLHEQSFGLLRPNLSMALGADWITSVDLDGGPVSVLVS
ncbi:MAG: oxidoreductase, partial [Anaerolineales bacterium]